MPDISNYANTIDSRDIVKRIDELENQYTNDDGELDFGDETDDADEHALLADLVSEVEDSTRDKARDGVTLVRDSYMEDYAREWFEETSESADRDQSNRWPFNHIDWEAATEEFQMDYTSITYDGVDYWVR